MWKYAHLSKIIVLSCLALTFGNICAQIIRLAIIYQIDLRRISENETLLKPMLIKSDFYFDVQKSPQYQLTFLGQIIACVCVSYSFTGYDGFFVFSILHFSGQLQNLQMQIADLIELQRERKCTFTQVLVPVIKRHQDLCRYIL